MEKAPALIALATVPPGAAWPHGWVVLPSGLFLFDFCTRARWLFGLAVWFWGWVPVWYLSLTWVTRLHKVLRVCGNLQAG